MLLEKVGKSLLRLKEAYDAAFNREVNAANVIDLMTARTLVSGNNNSPGDFKVMYHSLEHGFIMMMKPVALSNKFFPLHRYPHLRKQDLNQTIKNFREMLSVQFMKQF